MDPVVEKCSWVPDHGGANRLVIHAASGTAVGAVREANEDSVLMRFPVFVVADGMGGHAGGAEASALVVAAFAHIGEGPVTRRDIDDAVARSVASVTALAHGATSGPGSTLVLLAYATDEEVPHWLMANIGDSRAYLFAGGALQRISRDHSVVQDLVDAGQISEQEARVHPRRNVITRSISAGGASEADYRRLPVEVGARLMLCSDGLSAELPDSEIEDILAVSLTSSSAVETLIERAIEAGGNDNVTVVVIDVAFMGAGQEADTAEIELTIA